MNAEARPNPLVRFREISPSDLNLFRVKEIYQCRCCGKWHLEMVQVNGPDHTVATVNEVEAVHA